MFCIFRQKNEEKLASQKYLKESLNRPASTLQSINEDQKIDNSLADPWNSVGNNNESQNTTTYQRAYQNFNRRSYSSFDATSNNNALNEDDENQQDNEDNEQSSVVQSDVDQHQRARSISLTKMRKPSKQRLAPLGRASSSLQAKHRVESLQINDDDEAVDVTNSYVESKKMTDENEDENEEQPQRKDFILPPIKVKEPANQGEDAKIRKIHELKSRLSRQEEESKKQINELQTKQSRLENALKLLSKQTSQGKHHQQSDDGTESNIFPILQFDFCLLFASNLKKKV